MNNAIESKYTKKGYRKYQDEFIEKYKSGMSVRNIAEEYNISKNIVSKYIREKMPLKAKTKVYEYKEEIYTLYLQGWTIRALCKKFNVGHGTISKILTTEYGIKLAKKRKYEHLIEDWINDYNAGLSGGEIAKKYGVSRTTVFTYINDEGIQSRTYAESGRKYELKEDYFDILTSDKAYILGEYCASATIIQTMHAPALQFCLPCKQKDTILRLSSYITNRDETCLNLDDKFNVYSLRINSKKLCDKLKEYGFDGNVNNELLYQLGCIHEFYEGLLKHIVLFNTTTMSICKTRFENSIIEYFNIYLNFDKLMIKKSYTYIERKEDIKILFEKLPYIKDKFLAYYKEHSMQGAWTIIYEEYKDK